ncbi:MAG: molecular chaperone DnaJ [Clostridia bacterium]|nr:J domain-containing protein [Candidatus Pelethousia sp.]NCB31783.1 molecular chaperone DnaJ [Clostridia bacterium]
MNNPYKVLGVSENATPEEIRAAYLQLVKKYHPDRYTDPALREVANEKLMEINEAYELLTKKSTGTASRGPGSSYGYGGYSGSGNAYSGPNAAEFARARAFLSQNNLQAAKAVLDAITVRNAEWYYLYGIIYLRQGWYDKAYEYLTIAYQQEPGNAEYASAYNTIRHTGSPYTRPAGTYRANCAGCDLCASALCFSSFGMPCCCWC